MSTLSSVFCLTAPSTAAPLTTAFSIQDTLTTGDITPITGRLITLGSLKLLATPSRTVKIDNRTIFSTHAEAVAAVRDAMRVRVQQLTYRSAR